MEDDGGYNNNSKNICIEDNNMLARTHTRTKPSLKTVRDEFDGEET